MMELAVIILLIALVLVVAIRCATANFKRLRMGCFFDLQARELKTEDGRQKPASPSSVICPPSSGDSDAL